MYFEWNDSYALGMEKVDEQHRKLFHIGEKLSTLIQTTDLIANYEEVIQIIDELKDYTFYHFSQEEQFMEEQGYHDLVSHIMEHDFLRRRLMNIDNLEQPNHQIIIKLVSFLSDWIAEHILISDMKIRNYILMEKEHQKI